MNQQYTVNEKAIFLGPSGENRDSFLQAVQSVLDDIIFWRRNYHPTDKPLITTADKRAPSFTDTADAQTDVLMKVLAEMKSSVPFHSPRFLGHMHADLSIPALLGYFTGLLYNQNNVVGESAPVTVLKEMEFVRRMCRMIGYREFSLTHSGSWGHLCSGGTTANLEAMWIARNIKYYPLSLALLAKGDAHYKTLQEFSISLSDGSTLALSKATPIQLFNLTTTELLSLPEKALLCLGVGESDIAQKNAFKKALSPLTVQEAGVAGMHSIITTKLGVTLPLPKLYVGHTGHYSWEKNMDILGLGRAQTVRVDVDERFHILADNLERQVSNPKQPTLMVVGVMGTTEEAAIDDFEEIEAIRQHCYKRGAAFYHHIDGAYGGYFLSMLRADVGRENATEGLSRQTIQSLAAAHKADSIAIDPHKLGYVPYSAGLICFADTRVKEHIFAKPPYLAGGGGSEGAERTYMGGWTLEGSRSGAAALACYLSEQVVPASASGYGQMLNKTIRLARRLYDKMRVPGNGAAGFHIVPFYEPDSNALCYLVSAPEFITDPQHLNTLTTAIYREMTVSAQRIVPEMKFVVSQTEFALEKYPAPMKRMFRELWQDFGDAKRSRLAPDFELVAIRSVLMNPMIEDIAEKLFDDFIEALTTAAQQALPTILLNILKEISGDRRLKALWIENNTSFNDLRAKIELDEIEAIPQIGRYLNIAFDDFNGQLEGTKKLVSEDAYDLFIVDLNLAGKNHDEWQSGLSVIKALQDASDKPIVVFSQFLAPDNRDMENIASHLTGTFHLPQAQLIGKTGMADEDAACLIKGIFRAMQT